MVAAIAGTRSRRYPMFWSAYGAAGKKAGDLIAQHKATTIQGMSADEFFPDLVERLEALDLMRESPVNRDMAVARLKKAITAGDRIEIRDTIDQATSKVLGAAMDTDIHPVHAERDATDAVAKAFGLSMKNYRAEADTLLHLLATGAFHGDGSFDANWVRPVTRLAKTRKTQPERFHDALEKLRHYPALLVT